MTKINQNEALSTINLISQIDVPLQLTKFTELANSGRYQASIMIASKCGAHRVVVIFDRAPRIMELLLTIVVIYMVIWIYDQKTR